MTRYRTYSDVSFNKNKFSAQNKFKGIKYQNFKKQLDFINEFKLSPQKNDEQQRIFNKHQRFSIKPKQSLTKGDMIKKKHIQDIIRKKQEKK